MATKQQKEHYDKLARLGCILCIRLGYGEGTPAEIHHIRRAGKKSNAPVVPLCPEHHRGNTGIHGLGRKRFEREYHYDEESWICLNTAKFLLGEAQEK